MGFGRNDVERRVGGGKAAAFQSGVNGFNGNVFAVLLLINALADLDKLAAGLERPCGRGVVDAQREAVLRRLTLIFRLHFGGDRRLAAALMHHERMDGSGYPSGISGEKIDLFARVIAIVDTYEAMTSYRVYRPMLNPFQVIANYEKEGFARYDAALIKPILMHIAQSQLGMNVHLSDGRNAEVILINETALSRPMVKELNSSTLIDLAQFPNITIDSVY